MVKALYTNGDVFESQLRSVRIQDFSMGVQDPDPSCRHFFGQKHGGRGFCWFLKKLFELASAGDAELRGSASDHYTMAVTEWLVMNFDFEVVPIETLAQA